MPSAATPTDVADLLGLDAGIPADAVDRVERLLERAEQLIAADLPGFTFGETSGTVEVYGDGDDYLLLPYYPARNVTACTIGGTTVDVDELVVDSLGRLRRLSSGDAHVGTAGRYRWPDDGVAVVVTYDYGVGVSSCPPEVAAVAAELVAERYGNPDGVVQETLGDRSRMFSQSSQRGVTLELSAGHRHRLRHWRRNRFAAAKVRA
jgi:hypothetical protein